MKRQRRSSSPRPRVSVSSVRRVSASSLRARLREAEEALRAIREGEVDAVVVKGAKGEQVYTLSGAETIYRQAVQTMAEAAMAASADGRIIFCNERLAEFLQEPCESLLGRRLVELVPQEERAGLRELIEQAKSGPVRGRIELTGAAGRVLPVRVSASPLHQPEGTAVCIVATDLTEVEDGVKKLERVRLEHDALRDSFQRLRNVLAGAAVGLAITTPDGRFADVNRAFCRIVGYRANELRKLTYPQLVHPDDRAENSRLAERLEKGGIDSFVVENRYVRRDGQPVWVRKSISQVRDRSGAVQGHIAFVEDISEQKQAQQALRESEGRLQAVLSGMTDCYYVLDRDWRFVDMNQTAEKYFDRPRAKVLGQSIWELYPAAAGGEIGAAYRRAMAEGKPVHFETNSVVSDRFWGIHAYPAPEGLAVYLTDITQRKRAEIAIARGSELVRSINRVLESALNSTTDRELGATFLRVVEELTGSAFGFVDEVRPDGMIQGLAVSNPGWDKCRPSEEAGHTAFGPVQARGLIAQVVNSGRSLVVEDVSRHPDRVGLPDNHPPIKEFLCVPLKRGERTVGVVGVANPRTGYGPEQQSDLEALASAFVEALDRKRAEERNAGQLAELTRWQGLMLDREERNMELKREVNELLRRLGETIRYPSQKSGDAGTRRHGDAETRRHGDAETRGHGDTGTRRHGDTETRRRGDAETRGRGDAGTRRHGDAERETRDE
jgi:PAS domain S-box-containing protein